MKSTWVMRDGTRVRIAEMDTGHLANAILMLQSRHQRLLDTMEFPQKNCEVEQEIAEHRFFFAQASTPSLFWEEYDELVTELYDRLGI